MVENYFRYNLVYIRLVELAKSCKKFSFVLKLSQKMSPLSMCINKLLFAIIFYPVSEHKNDTYSFLSLLRDKKFRLV